MPEEQDTPVFSGDKTGTKDNIGLAIQNRLDQLGILGGVIFQVCVLDNNDIPGYMPKPASQGRSLAHIAVVQYYPGGVISQALEDLATSISGTVIDEDDLFLDIYSPDTFINFTNGGLLIIDRDNDGEFQGIVTDFLRWWS